VPHRAWKFRIQDVLEAIDADHEYTAGMDLGTFAKDRRTVDAVVKNLIVIGEAAANIPEEIRHPYPAPTVFIHPGAAGGWE
jgi:uncharacterized protein with HEPN domain